MGSADSGRTGSRLAAAAAAAASRFLAAMVSFSAARFEPAGAGALPDANGLD